MCAEVSFFIFFHLSFMKIRSNWTVIFEATNSRNLLIMGHIWQRLFCRESRLLPRIIRTAARTRDGFDFDKTSKTAEFLPCFPTRLRRLLPQRTAPLDHWLLLDLPLCLWNNASAVPKFVSCTDRLELVPLREAITVNSEPSCFSGSCSYGRVCRSSPVYHSESERQNLLWVAKPLIRDGRCELLISSFWFLLIVFNRSPIHNWVGRSDGRSWSDFLNFSDTEELYQSNYRQSSRRIHGKFKFSRNDAGSPCLWITIEVNRDDFAER